MCTHFCTYSLSYPFPCQLSPLTGVNPLNWAGPVLSSCSLNL
jgi:hypothetical protein